MTNSEVPRGPEDLEPDPIVEKLVSGPSEPAEPMLVLEGLLGPSARDGYLRLYRTQDLTDYAEFREVDVFHRERVTKEQRPFEGLESTKLWIRRSAQVTRTRTESRQVQASFLTGDIGPDLTAEADRTAEVLGAEAAEVPPIIPTESVWCPPTSGPRCGSRRWYCWSP